jgi:anthranilate phosphoribosyltransferase
MRSITQRVATGPELPKDISLDETRDGMGAILAGQGDPVQAGIVLIALRMKRETDDEARGILYAVCRLTHHAVTEVDEVAEIADPYDGYNRCLPAAPFLPAVLAECGVPAVAHGLDAAGPKFRVTHRHVLAVAGVDVHLSPEAAARRLSDPALRWTHLDQRAFCPALHDLADCRRDIVNGRDSPWTRRASRWPGSRPCRRVNSSR